MVHFCLFFSDMVFRHYAAPNGERLSHKVPGTLSGPDGGAKQPMRDRNWPTKLPYPVVAHRRHNRLEVHLGFSGSLLPHHQYAGLPFACICGYRAVAVLDDEHLPYVDGTTSVHRARDTVHIEQMRHIW